MDTLAAMRTFVAIVDEGSLTAAANALEKSQPAVVRSLAALESHLGARLLRRTTRRMSLTPEGREYLARCRQIIADVAEAERAVSQDEADLQGHLRITAPVQFGQLHVAPLLIRFLKAHPHVTGDLILLDRNLDLFDEGIDIAIRIGLLPDSDLIALHVGHVKRVVCASPKLLEEVSEPQSPHALAQLPCVRLQSFAGSGTWLFQDGTEKISVKVSGPLSCNQISAGIDMCVAGLGFGQFLSYQVRDQLSTGALKRLLEPFEVPPLPVNVVYSGGRFATARQRALASFLKEQLRERVFLADR